MRISRLLLTSLQALAITFLIPVAAQAQFGNAGATVYGGTHTPGVDMPVFGVYNYINRDYDASSTIRLSTTRTTLPRIFMENVAASSPNGQQDSDINGAIMLPADWNFDPWPTQFPSVTAGAPAHTNTRFTRIYTREVYNDMAIIWNHPPYGVVTRANTSYDLLIFVSWPAGVGQAFGNTYPAGSAALVVRYDVIP